MKPHWPAQFSVLLLALAAAQPAMSFEYPLSPEAIREAYFLGTANPEKRIEFFKQYTQTPAPLETGPDIDAIGVETPFGCVVDAVAQKGLGYHAPDAEHDFLGRPGCFRVRVEILFTPTYPDPKAKASDLREFWRDFEIHLTQDKEITPRSIQGKPIYSDETISGYLGANVLLDYDEKEIDPGSQATVKVVAPDGQEVEATFDLASLR